MKKNGVIFQKPYAKELLQSSCNIVSYIYPREELMSEPIFPYFVMDGGAFNFVADRFPELLENDGSINSDKMMAMIENGTLFQEFQLGDEYHWERSYAYLEGIEGFRKKSEWQIWPQRLYMILPLAQVFLKTGDPHYAHKWLDMVKGWANAHPYQEFDPSIRYTLTDMVWRDMQVAWRTLSVFHSIFMLEEAPFSKEDWKFLYHFLFQHATHLLLECKDQLARHNVQNHGLQIGVALLCCSVFFSEWKNAKEMQAMGLLVIKMNMEGIYENGGSNEDSPSYNHFIARLYLESFLLLKNNHKDIPDGLFELIQKQYKWIWQCRTPKGNSPRLSDSYSISVNMDLSRVSRLIDLSLPNTACTDSVFFKEQNMLILRNKDITLYVDALDPNGLCSHLHAGRPQTLLYYGYKEDSDVLIDAGCCNYDRWEYYLPIRTTEYHNVVYCPLFNDEKRHLECKITDHGKDFVVFEAIVTQEENTYKWTRRIQIDDQNIAIDDDVLSNHELPFVSHILLGRKDTKMDTKNQLRQVSENMVLILNSEKEFHTSLIPVMNDKNKLDYAILVESQENTLHFHNHMSLHFQKHTYKERQ